MAAISLNILAVELTVDAVVVALGCVVGGVEDVERRAGGARMDWPRDWERAFDDGLLDRVVGWLTR